MPEKFNYKSTPPMERTAYKKPQCLSSTAITLLPLWAVRLVQRFSECTVQLCLYSPYGPYTLVKSISACTLQIYIQSPYGSYSRYRASVPVQYSYTSTHYGL